MLKQALGHVLKRLDGWADRLYGWKWNPLYQSGALVIVCLAVLLVTGLYLIFFYRIGAPYESMVRIDAQAWGGRWVRSLHRYAADASVVAAVIHALRMFCQGRSWGPRALAWISGVFLVFLLYVCGWTGYVMVWDGHAQLLATEGARLLDALPLFSEPISRTFGGQDPLPSAFFFMNLFLHIAVPVGIVRFFASANQDHHESSCEIEQGHHREHDGEVGEAEQQAGEQRSTDPHGRLTGLRERHCRAQVLLFNDDRQHGPADRVEESDTDPRDGG